MTELKITYSSYHKKKACQVFFLYRLIFLTVFLTTTSAGVD